MNRLVSVFMTNTLSGFESALIFPGLADIADVVFVSA